MGLETKTLAFYIVSGALMLLSIWFLPSVMGIYSLLIGFSFVFGLTTVLNLWLLNKNCKQKPEYIKFLLTAFFTTLPSILFGALLERLLLSVLGTFLTLFACAILTLIFNILMYFGFGLISFERAKIMLNKIFAKKKTA
jgi:hypothetical protein